VFEFGNLAEEVAEFALHGKRAFGALAASGYRDVVEALAGLREKKRIRVAEREDREPRKIRGR